jgi:hypothetical protein
MLELIPNLINLYGIKGLEICQEESELEFQEKELKMKEKVVNGIHLFNILTLKILVENLLKKLKFLLDYTHI